MRTLSILLALSVLTTLGCRQKAPDLDEDGFDETVDCDDNDPSIFPGADELCDEVDNDCDELVDEDDAVDVVEWYRDTDGDGYGDAWETAWACEPPADFVGDSTDCDDRDALYHPGATEDDCTDPNDYNCDGSVGYDDADADGWPACEDCNDAAPAINPAASEVCDEVDNDCDGTVDGPESLDALTFYADTDADGFGNANSTTEDCTVPEGYVEDDTDCDDAVATIYPGAMETCNLEDDDCDGDIDEYAIDAPTWYLDADTDGFGNSTFTVSECAQPSGYVSDATDCDDLDMTSYPGGTEVCDEADNDCDGTVDNDPIDAITFYADADLDGYGDASSTASSCEVPSGYVLTATDCDDANASAHPGGTEVCDVADNDCDGDTDEDSAADAATWYADADSDGYGDASSTDVACEAPSGFVADATDCDDDEDAANPGEDEICDDIDNDCDGSVDEEATDASTWYRDSDEDGYGSATFSMEDCDQPTGYVSDATDCDDLDATSYPGGTEVCDEADNDCDGTVDDSPVDMTTSYADDDGDGYGDATDSTESCEVPTGYVTDATDCNDGNATAHPGALEVCDGVDNDCSGTTDEDSAVDATTWYADSNGDGYGDSGTSDVSCEEPTGYVEDATDCDDDDSSANPGESEVCDMVDNDCDGEVDEDSAVDASTWYADVDGDGYGTPRFTQDACDAPSGYVADDSDCDDIDATINVDGTEVCDGDDNDCDGSTDEDDAADVLTWYADADADGYGDVSVSDIDCDQPTGYVADATDCDDLDGTINPGESESCNGVDDDCSGMVDDGGVLGTGTSCPAESCLEASDYGATTDGTYYLEDSSGVYAATCDMTTDGGGWTFIEDSLLYSQNWVAFSLAGAPSSGSYSYDMGWTSTDTFWLQPIGSGCYTMALRATATLPFTYTEWAGEWSARATTTASHQDDYYSSHSWGQVTTDCYGHLKFGTDADDSKVGGEWGWDWNYQPYGGYSETWSWSAETVTQTDVLRWEIVDQSSAEDVEFYDIWIWVR